MHNIHIYLICLCLGGETMTGAGVVTSVGSGVKK